MAMNDRAINVTNGRSHSTITCTRASALDIAAKLLRLGNRGSLGRGKLLGLLPVTTPPENLTETCRLHNVRDLGVTVDSHLKFDVHMNQIVTRAHRLASLIHKCFASKDPPTLVHAFTSYVRPLLEYASRVWSPYSIYSWTGE